MAVQPVPVRAQVDRQPDALPALHRELGAGARPRARPEAALVGARHDAETAVRAADVSQLERDVDQRAVEPATGLAGLDGALRPGDYPVQQVAGSGARGAPLWKFQYCRTQL